MKKKQKLFLGFTVIVMAVIFTMVVGCDLSEDDTFPSEFKGTWKRSSYDNSITFDSKTATSTFGGPWDLQSVSGDVYTIKNRGSGDVATMTMKLENGNILISGDSGTPPYSWNGTWIKQ